MLLKKSLNPKSDPTKRPLACAVAGLLLALSTGSSFAAAPSSQATIAGLDANNLVTFNIGNSCRPWQDCNDDMDDPNDDPDDMDDVDDGYDSTLPPVSSVEANGPFTPKIVKNAGPKDEGWIAYPANIGQDGIDHPILVWGPGGGTGPAEYEFFLERLASHGFVVYSEVSTGQGTEMKAAIDWLIAQNGLSSSELYQNLNTHRIAAGGHSMGSITTFAMADDPRLTTTIHVAGGSFDGNGSNALRNPTLYIGGTEDFATSNTTRDYERTTRVPVFFTVLDDTDHIYATRNGMPIMTAWLRWHLAGEDARRADFISENCTYCSGIYDSKYKNWPDAADPDPVDPDPVTPDPVDPDPADPDPVTPDPVDPDPVDPDPVTPDPVTPDPVEPDPVDPDPVDPPDYSVGAQLYQQQCSSCHGDQAQGRSFYPALNRARNFDSFVSETARTMPPRNSGACDEECATAIGEYLQATYW